MKEYWVIWNECGDPVALTLSDATAKMWPGRSYSPLLDEPEWFQEWAEQSLKVI